MTHTNTQPEALQLTSALRSESDSVSHGVKYSTAKRAANELARQMGYDEGREQTERKAAAPQSVVRLSVL